MSKNQLSKLFQELDETYADDQTSTVGRTAKKRGNQRHETDVRLFVRAQEAAQEFNFTYKAARFEEGWLLDSLYEIAKEEIISDVLRKVKGIAMTRFTSADVVRHPLVARIVEAYEAQSEERHALGAQPDRAAPAPISFQEPASTKRGRRA